MKRFMIFRILVASLFLAIVPASAGASTIEIIYIGADDCFYCQHWEAARRPELLSLLRGTGARLVEIRAESVSKPVLEGHFPAAYRWAFRAAGPIRVLPSFLLTVDGKIVLKVRGTSAYTEVFEPALRARLAAVPAGRDPGDGVSLRSPGSRRP